MKLLFLMLLTLIVSSCMPKQPQGTIEYGIDPNRRYEIERLSFLPPGREGWEDVFFTDNKDRIRFSISNEKIRTYVELSAFYDAFNLENEEPFHSFIQEKIAKHEKDQKEIENGTYHNWRIESINVQLVEKNHIHCIETERIESIPRALGEFGGHSLDGGVNIGLEYYCVEPDGVKDLPPIEIYFTQSVAPGTRAFDPEEVLNPVFNSLRFKPVDRATSQAYQDWRRSNAEYREYRRNRK